MSRSRTSFAPPQRGHFGKGLRSRCLDDLNRWFCWWGQTLKCAEAEGQQRCTLPVGEEAEVALSATYLADDTNEGRRSIFQDVHAGGAASLAAIEPGDILLRVGAEEIVPPTHPTFPMGQTTELTVLSADGEERTKNVTVARPKGKKLHFVEPKLVVGNRLQDGIGYLKVAMFPGMVGVEVANEISSQVEQLGNVEHLIIDLRGNTGGGIGALCVMSLLTPKQIPVGFALDRKSAQQNIADAKTSFRRFDRIPASKNRLWLLALRYAPTLVKKSPIVLETEGLGDKPSMEGSYSWWTGTRPVPPK
ncbi:S41 family peptidase [Edaphobacter aggregans]|uniref:S41 family peptidase n=1 Tax=Edaphobacter aggregans TaxID=570835 RepID=UPI00146FE6FC|nr:S41 family peptidase [Edaphobacter aggregans]